MEEANAPQPGNVRGSVMVLGAGISGIQSSLDLADAGFKVYLVDKGLSIGGVMTMLDKTFPTNDCSMCILAPKLVTTGRHRNIEIITRAELTGLEGNVGNFHVTLKRHPRFVDMEKCNGCGDCVEHCPVTLPSDYDQGLGTRKAIFQPFPQAIPNIFAIDKLEERSPCRLACPAGLNAHAFVALASQERWAEAYHLIMQKVPLPGTLGRICYHPCEKECNRKDIEEPVSICAIRRTIADHIFAHPKELEEYLRVRKEHYGDRSDPLDLPKRGNDRKVAVIGSGPAGLTAASDLARMAYKVTMIESEQGAGGMLRYGIPEYRLSNGYLDREIGSLLSENGIDIRYNTRFGKDITFDELRGEGFAAFVMAMGSWRPKDIPIKSCRPECTIQGIDFLKDVNTGKYPSRSLSGRRLLVIGGGNVAMDCARSAMRLGADTTIVYRRTEEEMPAHREEIEQVRTEGITILELTSPLEYAEKACQTCLTCQRMELGEPDDKGRRKAIPIDGSTIDLPCDLIVFAIGQEIATDGLREAGLQVTDGRLTADPVTLQTSVPYIFAAGDAVTGPASAVEAIGAGHRAAESVDRYLNGEDLKAGRDLPLPERAPVPDWAERVPRDRVLIPTLPVSERINDFREVEGTLPEEVAVSEASRCLNCSGCSDCMQCVEHCQRGAVDHDMVESLQTIDVGAVILSPGFEAYRPPIGSSLGYGVYPNVLTSMEFERMLSASGPYKGHLERLSDGKPPKKIAWLQCVGSRDKSCDHAYCSSVCCMYSIKEAVIAKEHQPGLETHIYFMDVRSYGKDFEKYYERAENEYGVVFRRSRVPRLEQDRDTKELTVRWVDPKGKLQKESYDMVVLSVGLVPCKAMPDLSSLLGIELNDYGFALTDPFSGVITTRNGIYASGAASGPKDIPECVTQASAAAAEAEKDIAAARGTLVTERVFPPERDIRSERPRVGVFVCHCGINIGSVVDVPKVVEYARTLPYVVHTDMNTFTCSQDTQVRMKEVIKEHGLNRIVVASCTPRTHEPLFQETMKEAGLNPHLFEMANLRDQNSWVHRGYPEMATHKAMASVRMAVSKAAELRALSHKKVPVTKSALVIGGGIAGMTAALSMADQGYPVHIVEREEVLGGRLSEVFLGLGDEDPQELLRRTMERVHRHPLITVHPGTTLDNVSGYVGNFVSRLKKGDTLDNVEHGVVVLATGAEAYEPTEYLYGKSHMVIKQSDLQEMLGKDPSKLPELKEVVMVQCVGSRNDEHPYCSRICCSGAIRNAIRLKELRPGVEIYVLYRDIRSYGTREDTLYARARELGVIFVQFDRDEEPKVRLSKDSKLSVTVNEKVLGRMLKLNPDLLVLSTGIVPRDNSTVAQLLKVPLTSDGFFSEAHMKLRPVDFSADGLYLCGTAHSPRFIEETILQAKATAARAATILSRDELETKGNVAQITARKCAGCQLCLTICPYDAIEYDERTRTVRVNEILCQGCGACAAICPSGTSQQSSFTKKQLVAMIDACLEE